MVISTTYRTINQAANCELKLERSLFIGHCAPVSTVEEAKAFLARIKTEHRRATHNCPAYRVGIGDEAVSYASDAGEPAGTAGRPILGEILKNDLTNTVIVVTRYFGGKKLGVRGLIEAYGSCAAAAIAAAGIVTREIKDKLIIECAYADYPKLTYLLAKWGAETVACSFGEKVLVEVEVGRTPKNKLIEQSLPWARITAKN